MIQLELVTMSGTKAKETVHEVLLPTPEGIIAVFENHMPLVTLASPGVISVRVKANDPDDFMENYATNGGVIEVFNNTIRVLVDEADNPDEINVAEAQKAHQNALELRKHAKDVVSLDKAQSLLDRSAVRLRVAELKRHRKNRR